MSSEIRIVLNMIVKNESSNVQSLFTSLIGLIDAVVVLDTGSTDDTIEKIQTLGSTILGLEGPQIKVFEEPFQNFGASRTSSYEKAVAYIREVLQWPLKDTYAMFLDADSEVLKKYDRAHGSNLDLQERLSIDDCTKFKDFLKQKKPNAMYHTHVLPHTSYNRLGLARMDLPWVCKNACHEFWEGPVGEMMTNPFVVFEKPTGGNKSTKLQRELKLLEDDIQEGNRTSRNLFYYGRALDSVKNWPAAVPILEECIKVSTWPEERYESYLILGKIWALRHAEDRKKIEDFQAAQKTLQDTEKSRVSVPPDADWPGAYERSMMSYWSAFHECPSRSEAPYFLAFHHRVRKQHMVSLHILRMAIESMEVPRGLSQELADRPDIAWVALVMSLFGLPQSWLVSASKRKTSLFHDLNIQHDKILEELALNSLVIEDPEWKLRGHRVAEYLSVFGRSEASKQLGRKIVDAYLQATIQPKDK